MEKEFSCFFTGHRKLPKNRIEKIKEILFKKIEYMIEDKGVESFIAGGALGFDTLAAEAVMELKEKYPFIKLYLYLPCYDQSRQWQPIDKFRWRMIMTKVDDYQYITEGFYEEGCMQKRNYRMVEDALYGISYCVLSRSGTGMTMHYAKEHGNIVENIADDIYN